MSSKNYSDTAVSGCFKSLFSLKFLGLLIIFKPFRYQNITVGIIIPASQGTATAKTFP